MTSKILVKIVTLSKDLFVKKKAKSKKQKEKRKINNFIKYFRIYINNINI
jgi:hypothetical protein